MAASIIQPDNTLEERIYHLQKSNLSEGARRTLEEAAQLLHDGRHIEASALVDKAEAMNLSIAQPEPRRAAEEPPLGTRLVTDIANGLAKVMVGAFQDLERHINGETQRLTLALSDRLDKIQATVEALQHPLAAVQAKYEQLEAATHTLREADSRHDAEIAALRLQVEQLSASTATQISDICRRIDEQERQLTTASASTSDLAGRIAAAIERLDRQAGVIRQLHQEQQQRAAALDSVAELLVRLKPPAETREISDL